MSGDFGQQVVGIVTNDNSEPSSGLNSVYVACFNGANLLGVESGFTDSDEIPPGGFSPFTVDFYDVETCPAIGDCRHGEQATTSRGSSLVSPAGRNSGA